MHIDLTIGDKQSEAILDLVNFYRKNRDTGKVITITDLGGYLENAGKDSPWEGQIIVKDGFSTVLVAPDGSELHLS